MNDYYNQHVYKIIISISLKKKNYQHSLLREFGGLFHKYIVGELSTKKNMKVSALRSAQNNHSWLNSSDMKT